MGGSGFYPAVLNSTHECLVPYVHYRSLVPGLLRTPNAPTRAESSYRRGLGRS